MELSSLCQSLTLCDDEDIVECDLNAEAKSVGEQKVALSLFGKILSTKTINRDGIISTLNFIWRTKEPLVMEVVGNNIFVVHFQLMEDRRRILCGGPWKFQDHLIVLEIPVGLGNYRESSFDKVSFWVQIHNLPLMCLNKEAGKSLGSQIGEVEEVDPGASGDCLGKYIRVRVKVNIKKPLRRGLRVKMDDG
ncbi:uncharacterized protein LOC126661603 [Mercurialis annua]|uniref:uncharacterized protein LOC126661603 n=1 Tax=Mercurialis annua TaxID=3986 RepID=UPI00215F4808|nr:uncharacterized protein LOC126661603 [Mercurialis annua]